MIPQEANRLYAAAADRWGVPNQLHQAIEEMAELIVVINHYERGRCGALKMAEEIVDVQIMMEQLVLLISRYHHPDGTFAKLREAKLQRLAERLGF